MKKLVLILFIFISIKGIAQNKKSILKKISIEYTGWQDKKLLELILSVKCNNIDTKYCYCNCFSISKKSMEEIDKQCFNSKRSSIKLTASEENLEEAVIILRQISKILKKNNDNGEYLLHFVEMYRYTLDYNVVYRRNLPDGFFILNGTNIKVYYKNWQYKDQFTQHYFDIKKNEIIYYYPNDPNKKYIDYKYFEDLKGNVMLDTLYAIGKYGINPPKPE